jgi:hypothetical protein
MKPPGTFACLQPGVSREQVALVHFERRTLNLSPKTRNKSQQCIFHLFNQVSISTMHSDNYPMTNGTVLNCTSKKWR